MKLKGMFIAQTTTSLYGVWIPKWRLTPGKTSTRLLAERAGCSGEQTPLLSSRPLARDGGVITSFGDGMKALYKRK